MTKKKLLDAHGRATVPLASRQMTPYESVTFSGHAPTRVCNASIREPLKSLMREPARAGASDALALRSHGESC